MRFAKGWWVPLAGLLLLAPFMGRFNGAQAQEARGVEQFRMSWVVLDPITKGNLSIYPVVSKVKADTSGFLTLDEGVSAGLVRIDERGEIENALYRPPSDSRREAIVERQRQGASVNELVLINRSDRPLLLLAGEVVSGGKQNRIIGADMVVPPKSDPLPLSVFCVEHGRWTPGGGKFGSFGAIAHPEIRRQAQVNKSQEGVWNSVAQSSRAMGAASPTSSYADVLASPKVVKRIDEVVDSFSEDYERELRAKVGGSGAVGVVVAINGELVWSDIFPSSHLFAKYWPKLLRSYVMEAEGRGKGIKDAPSTKSALSFLLEDAGRSVVHEEPGAYRRTEISTGGYQIVALEALGKFSDSSLLIHYNKMTRD